MTRRVLTVRIPRPPRTQPWTYPEVSQQIARRWQRSAPGSGLYQIWVWELGPEGRRAAWLLKAFLGAPVHGDSVPGEANAAMLCELFNRVTRENERLQRPSRFPPYSIRYVYTRLGTPRERKPV